MYPYMSVNIIKCQHMPHTCWRQVSKYISPTARNTHPLIQIHPIIHIHALIHSFKSTHLFTHSSRYFSAKFENSVTSVF